MGFLRGDKAGERERSKWITAVQAWKMERRGEWQGLVVCKEAAEQSD